MTPSARVQRQIDALLDQTEEAIRERDWDAALECVRAVLNVEPANEDALAFQGMAESGRGDQVAGVASDAEQLAALREESATSDDMPASFANGRYDVKSLLGEGGKKKVYLAHDTTLDRDVAFGLIKAEGLDDASRKRITREAQAMARLGDNPNIMPIFDLGEENGQPYMVGPLMAGGDVESLIEDAENGRLPLEDALRITREICHGLEFAHSKGIIHRDLKPGNVWLTDDGTVRIGDFGLAISLDRSRLTQEKMMVGTVSYMPPEQATGGEITPRADLYSLGAMLYEMVTGRPPFMGDDEIAIIGQHINTPPVAPQWHRPEIPATLDSLIMRLLSKNPAERPDSAADVLSALNAIDVSEQPVPEADEGPSASGSGSLDSMAGGVFVGRHREMDQLKAMLENALSGRGGMVTLVGEPGIGKSRTALELETYAGLRNVQVLWGKCYEGGGAPPYWPWVQAIRSFVASHEPQEVRSQMGSTASVIAEIVADVKESLPDVQPPPTLDDPESARFRLFDSVATFVKNAGNVQPIVLVLDDLHWADGPSLKMLEFVARELASSRVMLIGTYRDMELNRRHPLSVTLGDLTREHLFERVLLRGLTREDVARFIEIAAGVAPPGGLVDAVHTQTEGNPLFVTETVRLLIQEGDLTADKTAGRESWTVRIPEGVREVIGRRLDRLSERCNEVLTTASVIGRQFTLDQLNAVLEDTTEERLLDVIDEGLASRTIEEMPEAVGLYQFTHALIQETLSVELSTTRKVRLHARIAELLETLYGDHASSHPEELVRHFAEAETILGGDKLIQYAILAGDQALARYAFEDGVRYFELAATAAEDRQDDEVKAHVLFGLGRAINLAVGIVESPAAFEHIERAFTIFANLGNASNAIAVANTDLFWGLFSGGIDLLNRALELTPGDSPERVELLIRRATAVEREVGDYDRVLANVSEAAEIARRLGDTKLVQSAMIRRAAAAWTATEIDESLAIAEEALAIDESIEGRRKFQALSTIANGLMASGRLREATAIANDRVEMARGFRDRRSIEMSLHLAQQAASLSGDFPAAIKMGEEMEVLDPGEIVLVTGTMVAQHAVGREPDMQSLLAYGKALIPQHDSPSRREYVFMRPAMVLAFGARHYGKEEWLPDAEEFLKAAQTVQGNRLAFEWVRKISKGFVGVAKSDMTACQEAYDELIRYRGKFNIGLDVSIDRVLGLLAGTVGRHDDATKHFEEALAICRDGGYRPELAWTCSDYAEMLFKRNSPGDRENATELQDEAIAIATELGMKPLLERVLAQREILKA